MVKMMLLLSSLCLLVVTAKSAEPEVYRYQIKGMKCADCVESVKKAVCGMNGIEKCDVSVGEATLEVAPGTRLDQKSIAKAVKEAGHFSVKNYEKVEAKK